MAPDIARRRLLKATGGSVLGLGTVGLPTATSAHPGPAAEPVSMAMHLHGSFSEGTASMDAHLQQARRLGVDVLWWTDHDFRIAALGYRRSVRFDGPREAENGLSWEWVPMASGALASSRHDFVATPHSPEESGGALRMQATGRYDATAWATYLLEGRAWNHTYCTSYADTVLELDVLPETVTADAQLVVEVGSSFRPATGSRPAGQYRLQYRVGAAGRWTEDQGRLGVIGIPGGAGWQRVRMDLRADHAALWPDTVAEDASLKQLRVGVRVRNGATARGVFDRLRFQRQRQSIDDGMALLRAAVRQYRERYPRLTQYAAAEISLVNHLNAFGGDGSLPAYDTTRPVKDGTLAAQQDMVRELHAHGAVVSINHPRPGSELAKTLVATNGLGADVIEIGTGAKVDLLAQAFDVAARNAVFLTANGVSDDHAGVDWLNPSQPRWITGAWARSRSSDDLCAALRAGRAWFYDPLEWSGELDLLVDGHAPMGGVLLTRRRKVSVRVTATRLPRAGSVQVVVGQCDRAGTRDLLPRNRSIAVPASKVVNGHWSTDVAREAGVYVRAMVRSAENVIVGFSNPVWVLPPHLADDVTIPRRREHTD